MSVFDDAPAKALAAPPCAGCGAPGVWEVWSHWVCVECMYGPKPHAPGYPSLDAALGTCGEVDAALGIPANESWMKKHEGKSEAEFLRRTKVWLAARRAARKPQPQEQRA